MTSLKTQQVNICNLFTILFLKRQFVHVCTVFTIVLLRKSFVLSNPKFHFGIHNCTPPVPNPLLTNGFFPQGFPNRTLHKPSFPHTCYIHRLSLSSLFYDPKNFEWVLQIIKLLNMQFTPLSCNLAPIGTNNLLKTLFSITLSLSSYLNVREQVSLSKYNRQNYNFLISKFVDNKQWDKRLCTEWKQTFPDFNLLLISSWIISNVPSTCV